MLSYVGNYTKVSVINLHPKSLNFIYIYIKLNIKGIKSKYWYNT